ncbi:Isoamylase [Actinobacteria bacterium OK074]|nr:Isoamylase [Actinobacteria bacterium OK074]
MGAHPVPGGVTFSVASASAERMWLVLLDAGDGGEPAEIEFPPEYRTGDVFTMTVLGLDPAGTRYGYRVQKPGAPPDGRLLLDPWARALPGGETWGVRPRYHCALPTGDFDWQGDRGPDIPAGDLVIYEAHVRGFTRHPSSRVSAPGTYAGLREKIPHLRHLGINCVELLPVFEFDETDNTFTSPADGRPLPNFWGYNTVGFFAPKAAYARGPAPDMPDAPAGELKELVRDLHRAGIEVILDVVFNHTAEGDHRGPVLSFRGLDEDVYYLLDESGAHRNLTATGNTVNANHPRVRSFILDCLRHWVTEFHIDGFRFDMAPILVRDATGALLDNPPLIEAITHDPVLARSRLIAEATDATGLDQVGAFPGHGRWMEWNGRYRDDLRRFLTGRAGPGPAATRLAGSADLYAGRPTTASVNYLTCHDGFTLADWTTYEVRRNHANGEGGQDGIADDDSWNCGHEGPTDDADVLLLRRRQTRNALALLLVSHGVPMLLAGDEFGRTQQGNNNAYSQDNAVSWLDWNLADKNAELVEFVRRCLRFRAAHPVLRRTAHPTGRTADGAAYPPVSWHGRTPWQPDFSDDSRLLVMLLHQSAADGPDDTVLVAANTAGVAVRIEPPAAPVGTRWHLFIDTGTPWGDGAHPHGREPAVPSGARVTLYGHSVVVLTTHPEEGTSHAL